MVSCAIGVGGIVFVGDGDTERRALPLDLGLSCAGILGEAPVPRDFALVAARLAVEPARLLDQAADDCRHGSAAACCMIIRPKRASAVAAAGSSSAVNSSARPAGSPLVKTGSGEPDWKHTGISYWLRQPSP